MKLHGHFISLTTLQVMWLIAEKSAFVEFVLVDVHAGEQKRGEPHLQLHPFGHIPVLEDGDFQLYETHAILRYLDRRLEGPSFIPAGARDRARMDQWLCIEQNYLLPAAEKKVMARGYAQMMGLADPGEQGVIEGHDELGFALNQFADRMAGRPFVAGESFSLADICWGASLHKMATGPESGWMDDDRIGPWLEHLAGRPAWTQAQNAVAAQNPSSE